MCNEGICSAWVARGWVICSMKSFLISKEICNDLHIRNACGRSGTHGKQMLAECFVAKIGGSSICPETRNYSTKSDDSINHINLKDIVVTCTVELLTLELWNEVKNKLDPRLQNLVERRYRDEDFIGTKRVIHVESGNYLCASPSWIPAQPVRWWQFIFGNHAYFFMLPLVSRELKFYGSPPDPDQYAIFCEQISEAMQAIGQKREIHFPELKGGGA